MELLEVQCFAVFFLINYMYMQSSSETTRIDVKHSNQCHSTCITNTCYTSLADCSGNESLNTIMVYHMLHITQVFVSEQKRTLK